MFILSTLPTDDTWRSVFLLRAYVGLVYRTPLEIEVASYFVSSGYPT